VFNFSGSEIVFLLLLALIILGPERLPDAVRKFGKTYAEFKKVTSGFQSELKSALDEPMREMRETADALKKAANFDLNAEPEAEPEPEPEPELEPEPEPAVLTGLDAVVVRDAPVQQFPPREPGIDFTSANPPANPPADEPA
jgi:sec-independent protein translocase protein TatB